MERAFSILKQRNFRSSPSTQCSKHPASSRSSTLKHQGFCLSALHLDEAGTPLAPLCPSLFLSSSAIAQGKKSAGGAEDQIKALLNQSREAALKGDSSYLEKNAAEDYRRVGPDGKRVSKSDWVNAIKSGDVKVQSIETSDVKVRVLWQCRRRHLRY